MSASLIGRFAIKHFPIENVCRQMAAETCYQSAEIAKRERLAANIQAELGRGWIPFIAKADHSFIEGTAMVELQLTGASLVSYFVIGNNSGGERNGGLSSRR